MTASALSAALAGIIDTDTGHRDAGDWVAVARTLAALRSWKTELDLTVHDLEEWLAKNMPSNHELVDGLGGVEVKYGKARKAWQSDEIVAALRRPTIDKVQAHEFDDPVDAVDDLLDRLKACVPFTGSLGWRVTALRDHGVDPDEYCESTPGRVSIVISAPTPSPAQLAASEAA